jgi:ATP-binding cassette subfamily B protein
MLTGKHVNKYYIKYWYFFLIGIIALVAVDYFQLLIPEYLGNIVDSIKDGKELPIVSLFFE